jgi:hypothetical protein
MGNNYRVGSLAWVLANEASAYREILESVIDGSMTVEEAREALYVMDTDSASA